jgi:hypothetical protein
MRVRIRDSRDFLSGLLFTFLGLVALVVASDYPMGTLRRMGPGYFPIVLGGVLTLLGLAIAAKGLSLERAPEGPSRAEAAPGFVWRPLLVVLLALVVFAVALPYIGLALAVVVLVLISAFAEPGFRLRSALPLALILAAMAVGIFVYGIGLPFRVWP